MNMARKNNVRIASGLRPSTAPSVILKLLLLVALALGAATTHSAAAQVGMLQGAVGVSATNGANGPAERLPGASVNLTAVNAGQKRSVVTNDQGEYKFTDLAVGTYTLQVVLNGFKEYSGNVTIKAGATTIEHVRPFRGGGVQAGQAPKLAPGE